MFYGHMVTRGNVEGLAMAKKIRLNELECTNCGAKLKKISESEYQCSYCSTVFVLGELKKQQKAKQKQENAQQKQQKKDSKKQKKVHKTLERLSYRETSSGKYTGHSYSSKSSAADTFKALVVFVGFMMAFLLCGVGLFSLTKGCTDTMKNSKKTAKEEKVKVNDKFKSVAKQIFGKEYEDITDEEWKSATELKIDSDSFGVVGYCIVSGVKKEFRVDGTVDVIAKQVYHFPNLISYYRKGSLSSDELTELKSLQKLSCTNSLSAVAKYVPNPGGITHLYGVSVGSTTSRREEFTNLKVLDCTSEDVKDFSFLSGYTHLEEFYIDADDTAKNFDVLGQINTLKTIHISANGIYSIDFMKNLNNLESVKLDGYKISIDTLEPLKGKTTLKVLDIWDCNDIKDYEIINTLTGLEELTFSCSYMKGEIDWSKLTNLKLISVMGAGSKMLKEFEKLPKLEYLSLTSGSTDTSHIANLKGLKKLYLKSQLLGNFNGLSELTNLEEIYMYNVEYAKGGEAIFASPKLQKLTMRECDVDIDYTKIGDLNKLKELTIYYSKFNDDDFRDNTNMLHHFTHLEVLTIRGGKIDNLDFLKVMPNMRILDVTNNNLSDDKVGALLSCTQLEELHYGDNAMTKAPAFNRSVRMSDAEESNIRYRSW